MGIPHVLTQQVDATTWQALGLVLTLVGLAASVLVWRSRGAGHGLRAVAWSLVPLAAGLTGVLRLAWDVLDSVLRWAVGLVFSPVVWLGLAVAVLALVLHVVGKVLLRRSRKAGGTEPAVGAQTRGAVQGPAASTGATTAVAKQSRKQRKQGQPLVDDQDDIEAILRKHGIS
jgi:hypothetical protein